MCKGLDITLAENYNPKRSSTTPDTPRLHSNARGVWNTSSIAGQKRSSTHTSTWPPPPPLPSKRTCLSSPTKDRANPATRDRIHRRVIVSDYGKPLYKACPRVASLAALVGCIEGYESLHMLAGIVHSDISIANFLMNEDDDNPSSPAFIIVPDLAIKEQRKESSGARARTGTRAFMAVGLLLRGKDRHSFMHGLQSFFWVLFWMCIHYSEPNRRKPRRVGPKSLWNFRK